MRARVPDTLIADRMRAQQRAMLAAEERPSVNKFTETAGEAKNALMERTPERAKNAASEHRNALARQRKERLERRKNALATALAGLLIALGNGVFTAEQKALAAMRANWEKVRMEVEKLGYSYMDMSWKGV
jgi:type VI protein secretion system component VasF